MFEELSYEKMEMIEGGGWKEAGSAFLGTVAIAASVPVSVVNIGAGLALAGGGMACLDAAI